MESAIRRVHESNLEETFGVLKVSQLKSIIMLAKYIPEETIIEFEKLFNHVATASYTLAISCMLKDEKMTEAIGHFNDLKKELDTFKDFCVNELTKMKKDASH